MRFRLRGSIEGFRFGVLSLGFWGLPFGVHLGRIGTSCSNFLKIWVQWKGSA